MNKVSLNDVIGDDPTSLFWQSIMSNPNYSKFEQDIARILNQGHDTDNDTDTLGIRNDLGNT